MGVPNSSSLQPSCGLEKAYWPWDGLDKANECVPKGHQSLCNQLMGEPRCLIDRRDPYEPGGQTSAPPPPPQMGSLLIVEGRAVEGREPWILFRQDPCRLSLGMIRFFSFCCRGCEEEPKISTLPLIRVVVLFSVFYSC